jgi:hypothetical protein
VRWQLDRREGSLLREQTPLFPIVINLRKIATLELAVQGPLVVRAEFACGVFVSLGLGVFVLLRTNAAWQTAVGVYFLCLGFNYIPMLSWVLSVRDRGSAWAELGPPWHYRGRVMRKYKRQSLILFCPLVPLALAFASRNRNPRYLPEDST